MTQTLENTQAETRRTPDAAGNRELILKELDAIVSSSHFRGSKRYPALLKYVVDAVLENRAGDLKERTLGVEVFGRDPEYDTNADPVVRVSAGEVRKRIAQFYHENGIHSGVQIELPVGSYVPKFLPGEPEQAATQLRSHDRAIFGADRGARLAKVRSLGILALILMLIAAAVYWMIHRNQWQVTAHRPAVLDELWGPVFDTTRPVLIVLRTAPQASPHAGAGPTSFADHVHFVSVSIAVTLAQIASILNEHGKSYEVKEAPETTLTDIRSRPAILVGAIDNDWTMRLVSPLRFHFAFLPDGTALIEDSANPRQTEWKFNRFQPFTSVTADYAIVARFRDRTTEGPVMVIAGLGAYGTEAAGEFVQSPEYVAQVSKTLPPGWENKNLEFVLKTAVIGYQAGPPVLVSAYTW